LIGGREEVNHKDTKGTKKMNEEDKDIKDRKDARDQTRVRLLYVGKYTVLDSCFPNREWHVRCLNIAEIPEGTFVRGVHYEYSRNAFAFVLEHPSFEPVPPGVEIPSIEVRCEAVEMPGRKRWIYDAGGV
jgi:hypothetical protein